MLGCFGMRKANFSGRPLAPPLGSLRVIIDMHTGTSAAIRLMEFGENS